MPRSPIDVNPLILPMSSTKKKTIGLLAGSGRFPIVLAESARAQGHSVFCIAVKGMADPKLEQLCDDYCPLSLLRIGKGIRLMKKAGVHSVVMAGKIDKKVLFRKFFLLRNIPDTRTLAALWRFYRAGKRKQDDTLLLNVIAEFEKDGLFFESALDYCPELLVKHGFLTKRRPSASQWRDINFGWEMAKEMGRLDIGQTVIVNDTAVIAVEAIEGTDATIVRAGQLCRRGGFTVVKVAKPQQDMRFDVPTIGEKTLQTMYNSGGRVLAIESDMTIMLDRGDVTKMADKLGIAIVSLKEDELQLRMVS